MTEQRPPDPDSPTDTSVHFLTCQQCKGRHMTMTDDELRWVCPDCGAAVPTIRGLIAQAKMTNIKNIGAAFKPDARRHAS